MVYRPPLTFARDMVERFRRFDNHVQAARLHHHENGETMENGPDYAELKIGDQTLKLAFGWRGLIALQEITSKTVDGVSVQVHPQAVLVDALAKGDVETVAKMAIVGLRKHHPALDLDWLLDSGVGVHELAAAIVEAFSIAWFGRKGPERDAATREALAPVG